MLQLNIDRIHTWLAVAPLHIQLQTGMLHLDQLHQVLFQLVGDQ
jgi:hypothetical protein